MALTVPVAGAAVDAAWGAGVANLLNQMMPCVNAADVATTSASFVDITGMSVPCLNGKSYLINQTFRYSVGGTSTGLAIAILVPGGTLRLRAEIDGNGSPTAQTVESIGASDTATGTTTTDGTTSRVASLKGVYTCTANGTIQFRVKRGGTSTTVTILAGSGGIVVASS